MLTFIKIVWHFSNRISIVAAGVLLITLIVECNVNIVGRYFRTPVGASYDFLSLVGALMVAASLIPTEFNNGHVVVSSFTLGLIKNRILQTILSIFTNIINIAAVLFLVWTIINHVVYVSIPNKELAMTMKISCAPFRIGWALGWALMSLGILKKIVEGIVQKGKK